VSALAWVAVGLVGGLGALARFVVDSAVTERAGSQLPWGTLAVNLSGAFALGVLTGAGLGGDAYELTGVAVLGSYTTFSTWMYETHRLAEDGRAASAALNVGVSLATGIALAAVGRLVGGAL
jgi:fluoride exporter